MGLDGRIGRKFLHPGPGYGGSCFPKDTLALVRTAQEAGAPIRIVEAVVDINTDRKKAMASRIIDACGSDVAGKTIAILGLTFKPNTDDMRESPSLDIVPALQAAGASVRAFDPEGMEEAKKILDGVTWCEDTYDAIKGSDAVAIVTEWNEFRSLDFARMKELMRSPILVDLRNIYEPEHVTATVSRIAVSGGRQRTRLNEGALGWAVILSIRRFSGNTIFAVLSVKRCQWMTPSRSGRPMAVLSVRTAASLFVLAGMAGSVLRIC